MFLLSAVVSDDGVDAARVECVSALIEDRW